MRPALLLRGPPLKRTPYNFCDYRCERCLQTEECDVYKRLARESLLLHTEDPSALLESLQASFRETENLIKQKARDFGIDIDGIASRTSDEDTRDEHERTLREPLFQQAQDFTKETQLFLQEARPVVPASGQEYLDDIAWHHTVVTAKLYRALGWKNEKEIAEDARDSAAVAMKSVTICIMSFDELASQVPQLAAHSRALSAAAADLKKAIKKRFRP